MRTSTRSPSCIGATGILYCMEAVNKAQAATGEVKRHLPERYQSRHPWKKMYERAEFAKQLGSVIIMIDLIIGYTGDPVNVQMGAAQ